MDHDRQPIGLIAGGGQLPLLTAQGMRAAGRRVVGVGLAGLYDPALPALCDSFAEAGLIRLGRWIKLLRRGGAEQAVMVGYVRKVRMYHPWYLFQQLPDWRAARLWFGRLRHDKRNDAILMAVADTLADEGITLTDTTHYIPDHLADPGPMTRRTPTAEQQADIDFALPIIRQMGALDVGQSIAVKDREVITVEAIEGTARMIERAGELCPRGGWTLVKIAKPHQDMRFDVPTIGMVTIESMAKLGGGCIALQAGRTIVMDKPAVIEAAEKAGIAIVGITVSGD